MGRIVVIAAAIVALTASWVSAGGFEVLADAAAVRPVTPLHAPTGRLTKVEFKSSMKTDFDVAPEAETPLAELAQAPSAPQVKPRPAVAYRERPAAAMAPPPRMGADSDSRVGAMAESRDDASSLESDLEKDLVLTPPPAKTEERVRPESAPVVETKPAKEKAAVPATQKSEKKKSTVDMKKALSPDYVQYATNGKPIQKVRPPISQNQWHYPAAAHDSRIAMPNRAAADRQARRSTAKRHPAAMSPMASNGDYHSSDLRRSVAMPPTADRFVRDGVTIKLSPSANGAPYPEDYRDDMNGGDIFATAAEIIGFPFAFISSLF